MMSQLRVGNFTSSEIWKLMKSGKAKGSFGVPALSYIKEKNMERRLGRSISQESDARPLMWGKLLEARAFDLLGLDYELTSSETFQHPSVPSWVGSPDGFRHHNGQRNAVIDFKAPQLKSFCSLVDAWRSGGIDAVRADCDEGDKYYWQLVGNACITGCSLAELIVYCPYQSELSAIRQMIEGDPRGYFISYSDDNALPYLLDGGYYKNINVMSFEVPFLDKQMLQIRVEEAAKELV